MVNCEKIEIAGCYQSGTLVSNLWDKVRKDYSKIYVKYSSPPQGPKSRLKTDTCDILNLRMMV